MKTMLMIVVLSSVTTIVAVIITPLNKDANCIVQFCVLAIVINHGIALSLQHQQHQGKRCADYYYADADAAFPQLVVAITNLNITVLTPAIPMIILLPNTAAAAAVGAIITQTILVVNVVMNNKESCVRVAIILIVKTMVIRLVEYSN